MDTHLTHPISIRQFLTESPFAFFNFLDRIHIKLDPRHLESFLSLLASCVFPSSASHSSVHRPQNVESFPKKVSSGGFFLTNPHWDVESLWNQIIFYLVEAIPTILPKK
jgi:hypothetical protein